VQNDVALVNAQGWEQRLDPKGGVYYYHPTTGMSLNQHPLDHHYQQFYMQMKAQYDAMYQSNKTQQAASTNHGNDNTTDTPLSSIPGPMADSPSAMSSERKRRKGVSLQANAQADRIMRLSFLTASVDAEYFISHDRSLPALGVRAQVCLPGSVWWADPRSLSVPPKKCSS
jgi:hypothetical protein